MQTKYMPADERRAVTVEAVVALAGQQNPSDITTAAIAQHMGVTQGALFRHFPNKEAILEAVMDWVADRLLARIDKASHGAATPLESLEAMFMAHVGFFVEHPGVPRMLFGELQRAEMTAPKRMAHKMLWRYRERLAAVIEDGKSSGQLAQDSDTASIGTLFIGMIQGLVMQSLLAGDVQLIRKEAPGVFVLFRRAITVSA
jgi:AcrR family transcriptional regulator